MVNEIELSEFIKQLKLELSNNEVGERITEVTRIETDISYIAQPDEHGKLRFMVTTSEVESGSSQVHRLKIELTTRARPEPHTLTDSGLKSSELSLEGTEEPESEFEGFKKRFQESVERHGGVPPNKKKNIFD